MKATVTLVALPLLVFGVSPAVAGAEDLESLCDGQAVGVVAELRAAQFPEMSEREIAIARRASAAGCLAALSPDASRGPAQGTAQQGAEGDSGSPVDWLKAQMAKEPPDKAGLDRLRKRSGH